jgi:TetR/AcrR family transcriptional regulator
MASEPLGPFGAAREKARRSSPPPSAGPASAGPANGLRKERNAAATRLRILDAAEREFAAGGFAGARLREIAEAAGVQPALIHHYFADKQGLYCAVLDRALAPTQTESWTLLENARDLPSLIDGLVEMLLRFHVTHQHLLAVLRHEAVSGSPVLTEVFRERAAPVVSALERFLEERQREGEVRADLPASEVILAGLSMVAYPFIDAGMLEVVMPSALLGDEAALARRKRVIVTLILDGIRPRDGAGAGLSPRRCDAVDAPD